jgi:glucose/mannose-6-phosphate isomerase
MRELIENFPKQLQDAVDALASTDASKHDTLSKSFTPTGVLILGMGGSGISGEFVSSILEQDSPIPVMRNANYSIPGWVNENTLVIACSYSGNTEETISGVQHANSRGSKIAVISSGGKLIELANEYNWPHVGMPGGFPPRSQFCWSFACLCWTLSRFGILPEALYSDLEESAKGLEENKANTEERARSIVELVQDKQIFIYSESQTFSLATRWRQQFNENGKTLVNTKPFPELNHNELVGWSGDNEDKVALVISMPEDFSRTQIRMELSAEIFQECGADVIVVEPTGDTMMERLMDLVLLGDFISLIHAEVNGTDPIQIDNIDRLKEALAKV